MDYLRIVVACVMAIACSGSTSHAARPVDVSWVNGDVRLAGSLYLPDGQGSYPAAIFLHGSGPETRMSFTLGQYAKRLSREGVAVLIYDKRGAGDSTGDLMESDYQDLAADAVAGIALLAGRDDIDAKRIGVIGASEGGWTGPLAANASEHVSWMMLISAPTVSPLEQGLFESSVELKNAGLEEDDLNEAVALERVRLEAVLDPAKESVFRDAVEAAKGKAWFGKAYSTELPDEDASSTKRARRTMGYDPGPMLAAINVPCLMLYGRLDPLVDAVSSARDMEALARDGGKDITVVIYPESGHDLRLPGAGFPEDHWDRVVNWMNEKGIR